MSEMRQRWQKFRVPSKKAHVRRSVAFLVEYVPAYRAPVYAHLEKRLEELDIELRLCVGTPGPGRANRGDGVVPDGAIFNANRFLTIRNRHVKIQRLPKEAATADLIIVQQETGLVINYLLVLLSYLGLSYAVWGHGEDPNDTQRSEQLERIKGFVTRRASWAFAYTERSKGVFERIGFPAERVTVVNNSMEIPTVVSTTEVDQELVDLVEQVKQRTSNVGWYVSSMAPGKRIEVLLEIVEQVREEVPDFEFFFLGDGELRSLVTEFCKDRSWAHDLGTRRDAEKAVVGEAARLMVMPGAVGLHVLDAFAFGSPLVAAAGPSNSHELDYLKHDSNGILLREGATSREFSEALIDLLQDRDRHLAMQEAGRNSSQQYSVESMTERFALGIRDALEVRDKPPPVPFATSEDAAGEY